MLSCVTHGTYLYTRGSTGRVGWPHGGKHRLLAGTIGVHRIFQVSLYVQQYSSRHPCFEPRLRGANFYFSSRDQLLSRRTGGGVLIGLLALSCYRLACASPDCCHSSGSSPKRIHPSLLCKAIEAPPRGSLRFQFRDTWFVCCAHVCACACACLCLPVLVPACDVCVSLRVSV